MKTRKCNNHANIKVTMTLEKGLPTQSHFLVIFQVNPYKPSVLFVGHRQIGNLSIKINCQDGCTTHDLRCHCDLQNTQHNCDFNKFENVIFRFLENQYLTKAILNFKEAL